MSALAWAPVRTHGRRRRTSSTAPSPALAAALVLALSVIAAIVGCASRAPSVNQCEAMYPAGIERLDCMDASLFPDMASVGRGAAVGAILGGLVALAITKGRMGPYVVRGIAIGGVAGAATAYLQDIAARSGNNRQRMWQQANMDLGAQLPQLQAVVTQVDVQQGRIDSAAPPPTRSSIATCRTSMPNWSR
jgi:hypothetical protein